MLPRDFDREEVLTDNCSHNFTSFCKTPGALLISDISSVCFLCAIALVLDRVFRSDATTSEVYEAGAKEVALSVVSGINGEYDICRHTFLLLQFHLDLIDNT